jgi:hypothetical protein
VLTVRLFDSRPVAPFVAYAACFAVIWGLIGLEPDLRVGKIAVALALQVLVGVVCQGSLAQITSAAVVDRLIAYR